MLPILRALQQVSLLVLVCSVSTWAQGPPPQIGGFFQGHLQGPSARGAVSDRQTGFRLHEARLTATWDLGATDLLLTLAPLRSPVVLDARARYTTERLTLTAGLFMVPFSRERSRSARDLFFSTRARAVQAVAPSRNVGVSAAVQVVPGLTTTLSISNGNGVAVENDNHALLWVGRLAARFPADASEPVLTVGVNGGYSQDARLRVRDGAALDETLRTPDGQHAAGTRRIWGADAVLTTAPLELRTEVLGGTLSPDDPAVRRVTLHGWMAEARWALPATTGLLAATGLLVGLDAFDPGLPGTALTYVLKPGFDVQVNDHVEVQAEVQVPLSRDLPSTLGRIQVQIVLP